MYAFPLFQAGDSARKLLDSRLLNGITEQLARIRTGRTPRPGGADLAVASLIVDGLNSSGTDAAIHHIFKIAGISLNATTAQEKIDFQYNPLYTLATPAAATDVPAIAVEPIKNGTIGKVKILGSAACEIAVSDAAHLFAQPTPSSRLRLTSATSGPARIVWKEAGTGNKAAAVLLGAAGGGGGGGFDPAPLTCVRVVTWVECNASGAIVQTFKWLTLPTAWVFSTAQPGCPPATSPTAEE